jgi:hypothetical protein
MAISDLYPTGLHEQNVGHFATIVRLALRDDKIDEDEHKLTLIRFNQNDVCRQKPNN